MLLLLNGALVLALLVLWVYCIIEVTMTPEAECRNLPKSAWLFIVILIAGIGSVFWLLSGRPVIARTPADSLTGARGPGEPLATYPDDDEEFLRGLRERVEEQRRKAREQRDPDLF